MIAINFVHVNVDMVLNTRACSLSYQMAFLGMLRVLPSKLESVATILTSLRNFRVTVVSLRLTVSQLYHYFGPRQILSDPIPYNATAPFMELREFVV